MQLHPLLGVGRVALFVTLLVGLPSWAADRTPDDRPTFSPDAAVAASLLTHSQVRSAEAALERARGQRDQIGLLLYNPNVSIQYSLPGGARSTTTVTQPLSLLGAGVHARRSASALIASKDARLTRSTLEVAAATRLAYINAVVAASRVQLAANGVQLITRLEHAVTRQQEEGEASLLDLRLARLARVQASANLLNARADESNALRLLASYTGRTVSSLDLVSTPRLAVPQNGAASSDERSDVVATRERLRSAESQLKRQRAASLPAVGLGVAIQIEDGQAFVGPAVNLSIPLFNRNQAGRAAAKAQIHVAEARVASTEARVKTERATSATRFAEAKQIGASLTTDPIEEARAALASVEAGYLAGEIDLSSTVLLQRDILDGQAASIGLLGQISAAQLDIMLVNENTALLGAAQ